MKIEEFRKLSIGFIHPDLGIVIDAAVGLQSLGHTVKVYTSHHDRSHSFIETNDGTLNVEVYGDHLPRSFHGYGMILFAILRSIWLVIAILQSNVSHDVYIVDQLSIPILFLRLFSRARVVFYCHFPDKLLSKKGGILKRLYRIPFDIIEEVTTGFAHCIIVNSKFTAGVFKNAFKTIWRVPRVVYPAIVTTSFDKPCDMSNPQIKAFSGKKEVEIALKAFGALSASQPDLVFVIAGGYDERVSENVEYLEELVELSAKLKLFPRILTKDGKVDEDAKVVFVLSIAEELKGYLMKNAVCLVYTPSNEHFGIVPVEAMYCGCLVVAVNSGGPLESIIDGETGFLVDANEEGFLSGVQKTLQLSDSEREEMISNGKSRVKKMFSSETFINALDEIIHEKEEKGVSMMLLFLALLIFTGFVIKY